MLLALLAFAAGALTILSPCILPVLPFVFTRAGQPFRSHGLPLLLGMAAMFALVGLLAALGGPWVVGANRAGRWAALALLGIFGLTLLLPGLADRLTRPLVAAGAAWSARARQVGGWGGSLLLGMATGLLWAPCAGPVLGLVLTGAALDGAGLNTGLLLLTYGAGAATSLALALVAGGRVYAAMKRSLGVGVRLRQAAGLAVLLGVAAIALGLDTGALARLSLGRTNAIEQGLLDRFGPRRPRAEADAMPELDGATAWLNTSPLTRAGLKGRVVLVDFWTYSCINCLRSLPYVQGWADKYRAAGLVVLGIHTPEFAFEREPAEVRAAVARLGVRYPVALDNDHALWNAFHNEYWPAHYLIDAQGRIRAHHFGEGGEEEFEAEIRRLLAENGAKGLVAGGIATPVTGIEAARSGAEQSPETYLGYARAERLAATPAPRPDVPQTYHTAALQADQWGLEGRWTIASEAVRLQGAGGSIAYRFMARDVHLVLGPAAGHPVRFRVTIDGHAPGADHGVDVDAAGNGVVRENRLYQLLRLARGAGDHVIAIEFLDAGVEAFAFTFG